MKYIITRVWHENTSKRGRTDTVAENVGGEEALAAILNAEASNPEAEQRIREHCTEGSEGWHYDFRDYTYLMAPVRVTSSQA